MYGAAAAVCFAKWQQSLDIIFSLTGRMSTLLAAPDGLRSMLSLSLSAVLSRFLRSGASTLPDSVPALVSMVQLVGELLTMGGAGERDLSGAGMLARPACMAAGATAGRTKAVGATMRLGGCSSGISLGTRW